MAIEMDCPHCESNKVETVRNVWYLQGFLLFARYGSRSYVGCNGCTRRKALWSFTVSTLLGWWSFPWGIGTPFVMLQNLVAVAGNDNERALAALLEKQGLDIEDFKLDERGRGLGDRKLVDGVLSVLHRVVWADGSADEREVAIGSEVAGKFLGDLLEPGQAAAVLSQPNPPASLGPDAFNKDGQLLLMNAACLIAQADGVIEESELEELRAVGQLLGLGDKVTEVFLEGLGAPRKAPDSPQRTLAADLLQVSPDASPPELRSAYMCRITEASQIVDAEERERHRDELADAYQMLLST